MVMTGQVLIGLAQPFVFAAPTRFSDLWFTDRGRTTATAIASLANPFGGAVSEILAITESKADIFVAWTSPSSGLGSCWFAFKSSNFSALCYDNSKYDGISLGRDLTQLS